MAVTQAQLLVYDMRSGRKLHSSNERIAAIDFLAKQQLLHRPSIFAGHCRLGRILYTQGRVTAGKPFYWPYEGNVLILPAFAVLATAYLQHVRLLAFPATLIRRSTFLSSFEVVRVLIAH